MLGVDTNVLMRLATNDEPRQAAEGRAGFADALIAHRNRRSACEVTLTFDRRLGRHPGFRKL